MGSGRNIRSAIEEDRAMIASGKIERPQLISDGESIAVNIELELDVELSGEDSEHRLRQVRAQGKDQRCRCPSPGGEFHE